MAVLAGAGNPESLKRQLMGGGGAMAFTLIFGGSWFEAGVAGVIGALVLTAVSFLERYPVPKVLQSAIGGMIAAAAPWGWLRFCPFILI